jgi:hypothetical protein
MTKLASTMVLVPANSRPNIVAAKMTPAAVITSPVDLTVRMMPERTLCADLSRIRG